MSIVVDNVFEVAADHPPAASIIVGVAFPQRVKMSDVARTAGVSVATVSKVVNGRYGVAQATVERVQQVIHQLGYEASLGAQSLRSHRTNVLGILVAEFEPFSTELLKGASREVAGTGYQLLAYSGGDGEGTAVGWERRSLARLSGTLIDGAVIVTPTVVETKQGFHVVAVDPHTGPSGMPTVDSDNFAGAVLATNYLLSLGHRRIGHISGRPDLESARLREAGFRQAMADAGVAVDERLVRVGGFRVESAAGTAAELLSLARPADRGLRRQRPLRDLHDGRRPRHGPDGARRPVRHRLRQRTGVGAGQPPADDDHPAPATDGRRGATAARRPDRRRRPRHPHPAPHRAGRPRVLPPRPITETSAPSRRWDGADPGVFHTPVAE